MGGGSPSPDGSAGRRQIPSFARYFHPHRQTVKEVIQDYSSINKNPLIMVENTIGHIVVNLHCKVNVYNVNNTKIYYTQYKILMTVVVVAVMSTIYL